MPDVAIVTTVLAPYRVAVFNAIADDPLVKLTVVLCDRFDRRHPWEPARGLLRFEPVFLSSQLTATPPGGHSLYLNTGILRLLARRRFEVIICGGYDCPTFWLTLAYARLTGTPVLLWSESTALDRRPSTRLRSIAKALLINGFNGYLVPGRRHADYLRGFISSGDKPFWLVPNAVDNSFFRAGAEAALPEREALRRKLGVRGSAVIYVGRLVPEKGISHLVEALALLSPDIRPTLIICGTGPNEAGYRRMAADKGLACAFLGFVQPQELPVYYALSDVLVLPSLTEAWGLVLNEAMACGLPVIATTVAGASAELIRPGENGYLFEPGDVPALAGYLHQLLRDRPRAAAMGLASQGIIQRFSPERCAAGFLEAIREVARRRGKPTARSTRDAGAQVTRVGST